MTTTTNQQTARLAGLLYLGVVLTGIFSLMYVPSKHIVWNDAAITYRNIVTSATVFRVWIVSGLLCYVFFLFLPLVLYRLLQPVHTTYAMLMVLLAVLSVPVFFINAQNLFNILSLITGTNNLYGFTTEQLEAQVLLYLTQYNNGLRIVHIFSGLWLFPFGYLVVKSGFLPKILGVLLMLGCFGYLLNFIGNTLLANYAALGISSFISLPASIGEIGICLWLLFVGVKNKPTS